MASYEVSLGKERKIGLSDRSSGPETVAHPLKDDILDFTDWENGLKRAEGHITQKR